MDDTVDIEEMRTRLEGAFREQGVRLAYLFGSQATGRARPDSDVDVAVLFGDGVPPSDYNRRQLELIGAVMDAFGKNDVDVVILNEAPPLLAVEVLDHGKVLYNVDDALRVEFQVKALREYRDTEPLRRVLREALEERVRTGRFGKPVPFVPLFERKRQC